ncbi:MAG: DUF1858 domain-containing protein [Oscillospiraceae bacterium]|nr:DUF1858 domain-containing protein [Oscillospiraceae bacterium]
MVVTKDTIINDILLEDLDVAPYFMDIGMHCIGCYASMGETVEEACMVHGIDPDDLVNALNEYFAAKEKEKTEEQK